MDEQLPTFHVLQTIKEAQQQHGLRHGDYLRYRQYCSRKLARIRKSLKVQYVKDGKQYRRRPLDAMNVKDLRYSTLLLFEADRNWAHAMQLKQEATPDNRKRFWLMRKLRTAVKVCLKIVQLFRNSSLYDATSKLEVEAYSCWMQGCLLFEAKVWSKAAEFFRTTKTIYRELASITDMPSLAEYYEQRCREIEPHLRVCQFNVGGDSSDLSDLVEMRMVITDQPESTVLPELNKLLAECREKQSQLSKMETIWCGRKINFSRSIRASNFYNNLMEFERQIKIVDDTNAKMKMYEQLLGDCRDTMQAIRDEFKTEQFKVKLVEGENYERLSPANVMYLYVNFMRLTKSIERYCVAIWEIGEKVQKPKEAIRLYDLVLQNFYELQAMPLVQHGVSFAVQLLFFKALRCYNVAEIFAGQQKWPEALALYKRTNDYVNVITKDIGQISAEDLGFLSKSRVSDLHTNASRGVYTSQAKCAVVKQKASDLVETNLTEPILTTLDVRRNLTIGELKSSVKLVKLPPDLLPITAKPLFFDLALNYVRLPAELDEYLEETDTAKELPKTGGISGLVKGWLWGSKS